MASTGSVGVELWTSQLESGRGPRADRPELALRVINIMTMEELDFVLDFDVNM